MRMPPERTVAGKSKTQELIDSTSEHQERLDANRRALQAQIDKLTMREMRVMRMIANFGFYERKIENEDRALMNEMLDRILAGKREADVKP